MVPSGFSSRAASIDDADTIYQLIAAAEIEWHGQAEAVPDQVAADLRRPDCSQSETRSSSTRLTVN